MDQWEDVMVGVDDGVEVWIGRLRSRGGSINA